MLNVGVNVALRIEIERTDDFELLCQILQKRISQDRGLPGQAWPKHELDAYKRLLRALKGATGKGAAGPARPTRIVEDEPEEPTETPKTLKAGALVLCGAHPNYTAARKPRTQCRGCWAAYKRVRGQ